MLEVLFSGVEGQDYTFVAVVLDHSHVVGKHHLPGKQETSKTHTVQTQLRQYVCYIVETRLAPRTQALNELKI